MQRWYDMSLLRLLDEDTVEYNGAMQNEQFIAWLRTCEGRMKISELVLCVSEHEALKDDFVAVLANPTKSQALCFADILYASRDHEGSALTLKLVKMRCVQLWLLDLFSLSDFDLAQRAISFFPYIGLNRLLHDPDAFREKLVELTRAHGQKFDAHFKVQDMVLGKRVPKKCAYNAFAWLVTCDFADYYGEMRGYELQTRFFLIGLWKRKLNNKRYFDSCFYCGVKHIKMKLCSACSVTFFCNKKCMRAGWKKHKSYCRKVQKMIQSFNGIADSRI